MGDLERLIPTFAKMKSVLTRKKIKLRPALPVNIAGIILTGIYQYDFEALKRKKNKTATASAYSQDSSDSDELNESNSSSSSSSD